MKAKNEFKSVDGNPMGGTTESIGLSIQWQEGPVQDNQQNGAFVTDVIQAAIDRITFYNESKFNCRENELAITKLEEALHWCNHRRHRRADEGTLNTYNGS